MWRSSLLLFWSLLERKTWFRSSVVLLTHCPCHEHSDAAATQPWCAERRGVGLRTLGWWKSCTQALSLPLPAPNDLSLSKACLWSSALKFCPESFSCSTLGHSDILSLLLLFEQIATLALFSFLTAQFKNWNYCQKWDWKRSDYTLFLIITLHNSALLLCNIWRLFHSCNPSLWAISDTKGKLKSNCIGG